MEPHQAQQQSYNKIVAMLGGIVENYIKYIEAKRIRGKCFHFHLTLNLVSNTPFDFEAAPGVTITEYLLKVMSRLGCSEKVVIIALLYAERYFNKMN